MEDHTSRNVVNLYHAMDSGNYFSSSPKQTCSDISKRLKAFIAGISIMDIKFTSSVSRLHEAVIK